MRNRALLPLLVLTMQLLVVAGHASSAYATTDMVPPTCTAADVDLSGRPRYRANCVRAMGTVHPTIRVAGDAPGTSTTIPSPVPQTGSPVWRTMSVKMVGTDVVRATLTLNAQRSLPYGWCGAMRQTPHHDDRGTPDDGDDWHWSTPSINAPCSATLGTFNELRRWVRGGTDSTLLMPASGIQSPNMQYARDTCTPGPSCASVADMWKPGSMDPERGSLTGYSTYAYLQNVTNVAPSDPTVDFARYAKVRYTWPAENSGTVTLTIDIPKRELRSDAYLITEVSESATISDYFFHTPQGLCSINGFPGYDENHVAGCWEAPYAYSSYDLVLRIPKMDTAPPVASCTSELLPGTAGGVRFRSTSTDPGGLLDPLAMWQAPTTNLRPGDDGSRTGEFADYTFTKPGVHTVTLNVVGADGTAGPVQCASVAVPAPKLAMSIDYLDGGGSAANPPFQLGEAHAAPVRVTVEATRPAGAVGTISNIAIDPTQVSGAGTPIAGLLKQVDAPGTDGRAVVRGPANASIPPFSLAAGEHRSFQTTIWAGDGEDGRYSIGSYASGTVVKSTGNASVDTNPKPTNAGMFGDGIEVLLALDPPEPTDPQAEGAGLADEPAPVDLHATPTIENHSGHAITSLVLDVAISSTVNQDGADTAFAAAVSPPLTYTGVDVSDQLPGGGLPTGQSLELDPFTFHVVDDVKAKVQVNALATGDGRAFVDHAVEKWKVKPKYLVSLKLYTYKPVNLGTLVKAGSNIEVRGEAKNLSNTDVVDLAPLYAGMTGNAIYQSFAWSGTDCGDPENPKAVGPKQLQPRASVTFAVCATTSQSDAIKASSEAFADRRGAFGASNRGTHNGGTRARLFFTPWATVTDEDGETEDVDPEQFKLDRGELSAWDDPNADGANPEFSKVEIGIDDSIAIPEFSKIAAVGAFGYGGLVGVKNGVVGLVMLPGQLLYGAWSTLSATVEFQTQVWESFNAEEQERFTHDTSLLAAAVLMRNAEFGKQKLDALAAEINPMVEQYFTQQQNQWHTGNAYGVVAWYGELLGEQVDGVAVLTRGARIMRTVVPIVSEEMLASPLAREALIARQRQLRTWYETEVMPKLASTHTWDDIGDALYAIKEGTELSDWDVERLFTIRADELAELQKLANESDFLLTVRSRHGSSLKWIEEGAELKPEALKIKSVSDLDARMGYKGADVGSLVFSMPTPLWELQRAGGDLGDAAAVKQAIEGYVDSLVGAAGGIQEFERPAAIQRMELRVKEWKKYETQYKDWANYDAVKGDGKGWVDNTFNWPGNFMEQKTEASRKAFRMTKTSGPNEPPSFELFLYNPVEQKWGRVTGDIDPISFTHLDGTPLTREEHAELVNKMRINPKLQAQHPESATYVGHKPDGVLGYDPAHDGPEFVASQFKFDSVKGKMEAALQIIPGGNPRLVRFNEGLSLWKSPVDYKLHYDGGYVHAGVGPGRGDIPLPTANRDWSSINATAAEAAVTPGTKPQVVQPSPTASGAQPTLGRCAVTYSTAADAIVLLVMPGGDLARVEGGVDGAPLNVVMDQSLTDTCASEGPVVAIKVKPGTMVTEATLAGASVVEIPSAQDRSAAVNDPAGGLAVGEQVVIGAGLPNAETRTIVGFGSIVLDRPLDHGHSAGEPIVVVKAAPSATGPGGDGPTGGGDGGTTKPPVTKPPVTTKVVKPRSRKAPLVRGTRKVGKRLTCAGATWTGTKPFTLKYAWQRKTGRRWVSIRKATKASYVIVRADRRKQLRCTITARNKAGSATAMSKAVRIPA